VVASRQLGEAEKVQQAAGQRHRGQACGVPWPIRVAERVEYAGIDHGLELSSKAAEIEGIGHPEIDVEATLRSLAPRRGDRGRREVNAHDLHPALRRHEGVLAGSTAAVEDR